MTHATSRREARVPAVKPDIKLFKLECKVLMKLCESFNTARSLSVYLMVKYGQWDELIALTIDPLYYREADVDKFRCDYQVTAALSKNARVPLGVNREAVALEKFRAAEDQCARTNERLSAPETWSQNQHRRLNRIRHHISVILGPLKKALPMIEDKCDFGPGATTSVSGIVTSGRKYGCRMLDSTPSLIDFGLFCLPAAWRRNVLGFTPRHASKLTTVPKNAKTDRVICIEPDLNIYVQKGIGAAIRERLRVHGLDLQVGQQNNQTLASKAYDMDLCTLDLSAASDTISYRCVEQLLPREWFELLLMARTERVSLPDGEIIALEKFSSMGNGYTFELETLIFLAMARAVAEEEGYADWYCLAYGDDLIFPAGMFESMVETVKFLGFTVNEEKTFGNGLFYESCGTDWFCGVNVRPLFLNSDDDDFISVCYVYGNKLLRAACRSRNGLDRDARYLPSWLTCFTAVDPAWRLRIPEGCGDDGFVSSFDEATPSLHRAERGWGGYSYVTRRRPPVDTSDFVVGCYTSVLRRSVPDNPTYGREAMRGRRGKAQQGRGYVFSWPSMGPWR